MKLKPYPKYKESGVQWIGKIPEELNLERFKIRFKTKKGKIPENLDGTNGDGYLPYLSMGYLRGKEEDTQFSNDTSALKVEEGDLLLLWDGSNAGEFISAKKGFLSSTMVKLNIEGMNESFSKYLCSAFEPMLRDLTVGMGIPHVNGDVLGNIQIPIFKPIDQKKISSFLNSKTSEISKTIEADKKLIELLQEKRTALINHVVTKGLNPKAKMKDSGIEWIGEVPEGWDVRKLKHVSDVRISNVDKKSEEDQQGVLLCNYVDVYKNEFITSNLNFMKATASIVQIQRFTIKKGDVIITKDSEEPTDIAVPALVNENLSNVVCGYHLALIRPNSTKMLGAYLFRSFQARKINDQFVIEASGVTRFGISTYPILNSYILVPKKPEQLQIVQYLDKATSKIDETMQKIEKKIELLEEYKKSLIHHVVTGKVDVRGFAA